MKYCTDDCKHIFDDKRECIAYEQKIAAEKAKRLEEEKQKRFQEVCDACDKYYKLALKFRNDYSTDDFYLPNQYDLLLGMLYSLDKNQI